DGRSVEGPWTVLHAAPMVLSPGFQGSSINDGGGTADEGANDEGTSSVRHGSARFQPATGEILLRGAPGKIWDAADRFFFVNQPCAGDFRITVQALAKPTAVHDWAAAGLMVRESLEPGSRHFSLLLSSSHGVAHRWRADSDGDSGERVVIEPAALKLPITLR